MNVKLLALFLALVSATRVAAEQRWYIFAIGDTPVGFVSEESAGDRTHTVVEARLVRLGKSFDMRFDTTAVETAGELSAVTYEALLSQQPLRVEARVEGDRIRVVTSPHERFLERGSAPLLGPLAVARRTREELHAVGAVLDYSTFSPELQKVVRVRRSVQATAERVPCNGATALRLEETIDGLPAPRTLWVDEAGAMVADATAGPFGQMTSCRSTREAALGAHGELPADLYERTVARSNVRFADPFAVDRLVLRIRPRTAGERLPDFATDDQTTTAPGTVEVRRPHHAAGSAPYGPADLEPNALVQSADDAVVAVARQVEEREPLAAASALTRWVAEHMELDAGIVMAPASELVRNRKATCVGYATLLAALARAKGIPARVVMGYVYYGGIWGGHAWTALWIDGRWLPFDAAVYAPGVASAARLSVGSSDLTDSGGDLLPRLAMLFGRVDVDVVEYEVGGRVTKVVGGESPFRVDGSTYVNPGLGLRLNAPGWTVERANSTWPSPIVVAFRRGDTTVELRQFPRYPERPFEPDGDATFSSVEGGMRWVWSARGPGAASALREILGRAVVEPPAGSPRAAGQAGSGP